MAGKARPSTRASGVSFALTSNLAWAAQPLYWPLVGASGPVELVAHRVFWSALVCVIAVLLIRARRTGFRQVIRQPRAVALLSASGACLTAAWGVYIYAVITDRVIEGSFGLFLIPLATVLAGVFVFGERLRVVQWVAVGGTCAGTVVLTVSYGRLPWIGLATCGLMTVYAVLKKKTRAPVLEGFTVECLAVVPLAFGVIGWLIATGGDTVGRVSIGHTALVAASGLITAVPLLAHAAGLVRLPLVTVGVLQYVNPTAQFLLAVLVLNETISTAHWVGFAIVWASIAVFASDTVRLARRRHGQRGTGALRAVFERFDT